MSTVAKDIAPFRLQKRCNARLRPRPVAVTACKAVSEDWHARFSCIGRSYLYRIVNRRAPLTLERGKAWLVHAPLECEAMHRAAQRSSAARLHHLPFGPLPGGQPGQIARPARRARGGESRCSSKPKRAQLPPPPSRSMVGCLVLVGLGRWPKRRSPMRSPRATGAMLGLNAPPDGLYFTAARYRRRKIRLPPRSGF
jgi:tRNA pseudouridine38-40 synthase